MMQQAKIIGILNLTPDSFSDGGDFVESGLAISRAQQLFSDGAEIVDIGAESTGPGASPIDANTELNRLGKIVRSVSRFGTVSVDTYKAVVAAEMLSQGASIINDVSALRADPQMPEVIRAGEAQLIMMYAKDSPLPHVTETEVSYRNLVSEIGEFLLRRIDFALAAGLSESRLILDPGMGRFLSKDAQHSWNLLAHFNQLVERLRPFPVLVGTSRKGFLSSVAPQTLNDPKERDPLSALSSLCAVERGASYVRTHNVAMMVQLLEAHRKLNESVSN